MFKSRNIKNSLFITCSLGKRSVTIGACLQNSTFFLRKGCVKLGC
jgi:hypothetical protein